MATVPTVMTATGLQPQSPSSLLAQLLALVSSTNPDYTANLPGTLIEDISSTDVGALTLIDQLRVELVNSLTPYGANAFLLNQLGAIYGVAQGTDTNTSVYVVFTGTPGYVINRGFTVSDGTYQYIIQDGGIIQSGGTSAQLYAVATQTGSWAVPANTVTQLITSIPTGVTLTVTNPNTGTPSSGAQSLSDYRSQVLQAGRAASQGMATYLKTLVGNVPGVQKRLVSAVQVNGGGWEIIVGGGDPYAIAYAIYSSLLDISTLAGSTNSVTAITQANPGQVTTYLNHGLTTGETATLSGVNPSNYNGSYTITVIDEKNFTIGVNTTSYPAYVSGGVVTPNPRNLSVNIVDYPDTYTVPIVVPPQETVTMTVTWNTTATNVISNTSVASAAGQALVNYINSIPVGQPINQFELDATFQAAWASATTLPVSLLTRLVFAVNINGVSVPPESGTGIIAGDPESYFYATLSGINIVQG